MRSFVDELPPALKSDIIRISEENDGAFTVFQDLYNHLTSVESINKKRKLEIDLSSSSSDIDQIPSVAVASAPLEKIIPSTIIFQLRDLSFQSPLRKKLNLTISVGPSTQKPVLSIGKSNDDKPELVITDLSQSNIKLATFLPVAEKKNMLYLVIWYQLASEKSQAIQGTTVDPIVLMMNKENVMKQLISDKYMKADGSVELLIQQIIRHSAVAGFKIVETFSPKLQSFYVEAHRGPKEGILYFLPSHILFGFKKPILIFESHEIESISYSSITRITFNVTLALKSGEKFEFSMIDQVEFAQIDDYVKNRAVQDMSMTAGLKEKTGLYKGQKAEGSLMEATQQLEGDNAPLEALVGGDDDEDDSDEDDDDYQVGKEIDDTSDVSGDEQDVHETVDVSDDSDDSDEDDSDVVSDDGEELSGDVEIELNSDDD